MDLPRLLLIGCLFCCKMIVRNHVQAATLSDVGTVCAEEGGTSVFPWSLTLDPGETLNRIEWVQINPTNKLVLEVDGSGTQTQYDSRASTNGSAFLILANVTADDVGTYRCSVVIVGSAVRQEDVAQLELPNPELPDLDGVTVTVREDTCTSVTVEWPEVPVSDTCDEVLTYYIEYKLGTSGSWELAGSVEGSVYGNTTLNFTVTGLQYTELFYKFGVSAENSLGTSSRVESSDVFIPLICRVVTLPIHLVIVFLCQALWAAILMIAILVADKNGKFRMVKLLAIVGPLVGVVLAVVVIILAYVPPNSGNVDQQGFIIIVVVSAVAAAMSIAASIAGCLFEKCCNFPVVTMVLEFLLGMMIATAGIVVSVLHVQEQGTKVAGIAFGAFCIAVLVAAFIWFMVRVCGNRQCSKVSQDLSEARSQNQVELEQQSAQAEEKTAKPAQQPPENEKEGS